MAKSNPHKVNQYTKPDPRQSLFLSYYIDPKSETFSNAYKSALKAGYEDEYAKVIITKDLEWLSSSVSDASLLNKAETRLNQILDFEPVDEEGKIDNALIANQMKAVTLVAKGIGKNKYSERVEQTGANGKELPTPLLVKIIGEHDTESDGDTD